MKDSRNILSGLLFFLLLACLIGCIVDETSLGGVEATVSINLLPTRLIVSGDGTKSVDKTVEEGNTEGYSVADFWLFEYDENSSLLGTPRYYSSENYDLTDAVPASVILPSSANVQYTIVIVANTHDPSFLSTISYNTLTSLKRAAFSVTSSADLYQGNDLLMNGIVTIESSTSGINCNLYRNVAKVSINIKNSLNSDLRIDSAQLKNVPAKLYVADQLYSKDTFFPGSSEYEYRSLEKEYLNLKSGDSKTLLYYLPRNMKGTNSSVSEGGKNVNAPKNATFIEIYASREKSTDKFRYTFYLGENNINDFNIKANHSYDITLNFDGVVDENDNRVERADLVRLKDANSYIINPNDGPEVRYVVPIENRIRTYWESVSGKLNPNWKEYLVGNGKEWIAEVIWQDIPGQQVIKFCNNDGSLSDSYRGAIDEMNFVFSTTENAKNVVGNVLIGVRRADEDWSESADGYMWSWHLWITDYDPYEEVGPWMDDIYVYDVTGGSVQRYSSFDDINRFKEGSVYVMDRNLGAKGFAREDGWALCTGMLYQFGRKDPFPPSDAVYDIAGVANTTIARMDDQVGINEAVLNPKAFMIRKSSSADWTFEEKFRSYDWNDIIGNAIAGTAKSFFDPCPPGWQLPFDNIWNDFGSVDAANASNWVSDNIAENTYYTNPGKQDAGWLYYLNGKEKAGEVTYYPGSGMRNHTTGNYSGGANGALWSARSSDKNGTYLYYDNAPGYFMKYPSAFNRQNGMPVRCITSRDAE